VSEELERMQSFLLGPLGNASTPFGVADAVDRYIATGRDCEGPLALEVMSGLKHAGYEI
jgi:hypothetical protein